METRLPLITPGTKEELEGPGAGVTLRIRGAGSNVFLGRGRGWGGLLPKKHQGSGWGTREGPRE